MVSLAAPTSVTAGTRPGGPRRPGATHCLLVGLVVFLATVIQAPARFVFDAATYWAGSVSLAQGSDPSAAGLWNLRGVLTSVLYLPAALATRALGESAASTAVLVENSLLVAFVGALLLPWVLRAWGPVTPPVVWACGALTWLSVGRFAPYPLVDLWAAALMLAAVVALQRRTVVGLMGAGVLAGAAFNVRPAYLLPLLLVLAVVFLSQRLAGLWLAAGMVAALVPQSIVNLTGGGSWRPWPSNMLWLSQAQAHNASFVVRYGTVRLTPGDPQQFFCSPFMAQAAGDHPPGSTGELAVFYLQNLPHSVVFVAEKLAAALHWPLSGPYSAPTGAGDLMFAFLVTLVTVVGAVSAVKALTRGRPTGGLPRVPVAAGAALAVWLGSLITIITVPPETRFALPLVLLGVAGCAALVSGRPGSRWDRRWIAGAGLAVAVVFGIGLLGLSHPAAPGPASLSTCAAT